MLPHLALNLFHFGNLPSHWDFDLHNCQIALMLQKKQPSFSGILQKRMTRRNHHHLSSRQTPDLGFLRTRHSRNLRVAGACMQAERKLGKGFLCSLFPKTTLAMHPIHVQQPNFAKVYIFCICKPPLPQEIALPKNLSRWKFSRSWYWMHVSG